MHNFDTALWPRCGVISALPKHLVEMQDPKPCSGLTEPKHAIPQNSVILQAVTLNFHYISGVKET